MVKEINKNEIEECVQIIRASFKTVADELGFTEIDAPGFTAFATDSGKLSWQIENEPRKMFAYFDNDKIVGYYSILLQNNKECELNNLCVSPEYRHQKIGEQLYHHAIETAKKSNCKVMNLGIVEENKKLRTWYEDLGAIHIGTKKYEFFPFTCGYMKVDITNSLHSKLQK